MPLLQKFKQGLELWDLQIRQGGLSGFLGIFKHSNTANRTYTLPDKDGTLATLADISGGGGGLALTSPLTGYTAINDITPLSSTDSVLTSFEKLQAQNAILASQSSSNASAIGPWTPYSPIISSSGTAPVVGNGILNGYYRRVGDSAEIELVLSIGSTTNLGSGYLLFSIPPNLTIDTLMGNAACGPAVMGNGSATYNGMAQVNGNKLLILCGAGQASATQPFKWANGHYLILRATVQIAQWSANINLIKDFQEFISCDGTTGVAANTTYTPTTKYGSQGSSFPGVAISGTSVSTFTSYILTLSQPAKSTDLFVLEYTSNGISWQPVTGGAPIANGVGSGPIIGMWISYNNATSNTIMVNFSNAGRQQGRSYGVASSNWAGLTGWSWRIRKISNGNFAQGSPSFPITIGDGVSTTIDITHNLGVTDCDVSIWELNGLKRKVDDGVEIRSLSSTQVRLVFNTAPALNSLRAIVFSSGGTSAPFTDPYLASETLTNKTWIDGKPIYRKIISVGPLPNATTKTVAHGIIGLTMITSSTGVAKDSSNNMFSFNVVDSSTILDAVSYYLDLTNVYITTGINRSSSSTAYITLEYIK